MEEQQRLQEVPNAGDHLRRTSEVDDSGHRGHPVDEDEIAADFAVDARIADAFVPSNVASDSGMPQRLEVLRGGWGGGWGGSGMVGWCGGVAAGVGGRGGGEPWWGGGDVVGWGGK